MNNIDKKGLKNSKLLQMMFKKLLVLHTQLTFHQWEFVFSTKLTLKIIGENNLWIWIGLTRNYLEIIQIRWPPHQATDVIRPCHINFINDWINVIISAHFSCTLSIYNNMLTYKSKNILWQNCDWSALRSSHYQNLLRDRTREGRTLGQMQEAL